MQKKQVKIAGFQNEEVKIKLFYETDGIKSEYVVEINRRQKKRSPNYEEVEKKFRSLVITEMSQQKLNI